MPITCPISCKMTPSNEPSASKLAISAMSSFISPLRLMLLHEAQTDRGPADP